MANLISTQARLSTGSRRTVVRAPVLRPIPMLLAAVLVGCASSVHHSTGALTGQAPAAKTTPARAPAHQPAPYKNAAAPSAEPEETAPAPQVFKDEGGGDANESAAPPERFEEEATQQEEPARDAQQFKDETNTAAPDEHFAQHPFVADEVPSKDEASAAPQRFTDDAPTHKDERVANQHFTDDAAPAMDEDIATREQFTDDAPATKDEVVATEEYSDESAAAPEELVRPPESFTDQKVAQAEAKQQPVTMLPMTVTLEADPLFEFDRDSIGAEARRKLDELIRQLKGIPYGEVVTLGFTDPIGTHAYNQKLSERRAMSVQQYLVSNGIPADKIRTEARGETEEFASYKGCKDQSRQKLIACLQPDRRVEVTVTATKKP